MVFNRLFGRSASDLHVEGHMNDQESVEKQFELDEGAASQKFLHRVIVKDGKLYQARTIDPDQAMWIAKANSTLSPETFTLKYDNKTLVLNRLGTIVGIPANMPGMTTVIVKDHLIYEARRIPDDHARNIATTNGLALPVFLASYANCTLIIDAACKIIRNQTATMKTSLLT